MFNISNIKYDNHPFDHWLIEDFLNVEDAWDPSLIDGDSFL